MATKVLMPKLGLTMERGQVARWFKAEGERIAAGEPLLEIMTDKINYEIEAPVSGVLLKQIHGPGEEVPVETIIGYIGEEDEELNVAAGGQVESDAPGPVEIKEKPVQAASEQDGSTPEVGEKKVIRISPRARRLALEEGINFANIKGSGPMGRIIEKDIKRAIETGARGSLKATPAAEKVLAKARKEGFEPSSTERIKRIDAVRLSAVEEDRKIPVKDIRPYSGMRKVIGDRLVSSKLAAPHIYLTIEVDVTDLAGLRAEINSNRQELGQATISYNVFVIKAAAKALREHSQINASLVRDEIHLYDQVNIGLAVALNDGLIVPVIKEADRPGIDELAAKVKILSNKAREGMLAPDDIQGGTFTITNLGSYGIEEFGAVINPPESAILAVGAVKDACIPRNGKVTIGKTMKLTLCADHRLIDGAVGANYLKKLKEYLEHPALILL
ncbi:MAG: dihydrolipoamide acetyltransferase family protein [Halanaerobium sp.]|nr:dihydrolipoamide acetyltransferase family protein [Halanaerobium sp.]